MSEKSVFHIFEKLESTASRNEMVEILLGFYKSLDVVEGQIYTYLFKGRLVPLFVDREFNFSERSALKVLENINGMYNLGVDVFKLRSKLGDAGLVAKELLEKKGRVESDFDINHVYENLWKLVGTEGSSSVKGKSDIFSALILSSSPQDAKFLTRIISGKLRLGCSDKTILDAFSKFLVGDKSARDELDNAYGVVSDLGFVCNIVFSDIALEEKLEKLRKIAPIPGIPIAPRLVERVSSFENAVERFPEGGILQPKYDGLRCQIHKGVEYSDIYDKSVWVKYIKTAKAGFGLFESASSDNGVKLFSRNLNDITEMFPELVEELRSMKSKSFILDGEIIGWDERSGRFIPFQETMSRKRKYGIVQRAKSVPVKFFAFDLLSLDGKNVLNDDLEDRLGKLKGVFLKKEGGFVDLTENVFFDSDVKELSKHFDRYVEDGLEGVILKKKKGGYLPGVRNFDWMKIKKSMGSKVVDTIDAVVLGYYYGSGRKTEFGMGSLLVGVYNSDEDVFESVGKVGTGFTDADWEVVAKRLIPLEMKEKSENVRSELSADVWLEPEVVISVEADEISKSSVHLAGKSSLGFGLSLRFPRLISFGRDKLAHDCTSTFELVGMWNMRQGQKKDPQI